MSFVSQLHKIEKKLSQFLKDLFETILSIFKVLILSSSKNKLPVSQYNDCVILGNGPSLSNFIQKNIDSIKNKELFCVNNFASTDYFEKLQPKNYVIKDPIFWSIAIDAGSIKALQDIEKKTMWPMRFFIPYEARKCSRLNSINKSNQNIEICFYNQAIFKGFEQLSFSFYKKNLAMPQAQNVLVACLFLSINMRFKNIFLAGADHNWLESLYVDKSNRLCVKEFHFYTEKPTQVSYQLFYKNLETKEMFTMREILVTFSKVFAGYENISKYAEHMQSKVWNVTDNSFIDAFERKNMD